MNVIFMTVAAQFLFLEFCFEFSVFVLCKVDKDIGNDEARAEQERADMPLFAENIREKLKEAMIIHVR
jgi:hypothetical protein